MSDHSFRVLALHPTGVASVHPAGLKSLSKRDAQRLAGSLLSEGPANVVTAHVVRIVMTLNPED